MNRYPTPNFFHRSHPVWALLLTLTASVPTTSDAEETLTQALDEWWRYTTIYQNNQNPILQEFKLRGRYQGQYWNTDADQGNQSNWEDRRSRFGFDAKLFDKKIEVRADFQSNDGFDDIYDGLVDAYIRWKPTSSLSFTFGKMKPLIAHYDFLESTTTQPTFERSQIFNQLGVNRASGFTAEGNVDAWSWRAGIYSNDTPTNTGGSGAWGDGEFGDFNGGVSTTLGIGYDLKDILHADDADFHIDWLHSDREAGDYALARYDDMISTTFVAKQSAATVVFESFFASGGNDDDSNVYGFYVQPTYDIIPEKLQLVGRYSYANSAGPLGVIAQGRYEKTIATGGGRGDNYNAVYGGIQYFIHGDQLKILAGAEWAQLKGNGEAYQGTTLLTGLRFSF